MEVDAEIKKKKERNEKWKEAVVADSKKDEKENQTKNASLNNIISSLSISILVLNSAFY